MLSFFPPEAVSHSQGKDFKTTGFCSTKKLTLGYELEE